MGMTPTWPPKLVRKPNTIEARTYYRGRYWTCGKWDDRRNCPSDDAKTKHLELITLWSTDPDAAPGGKDLLTESLADWLESSESPVHRADRLWIPKIIERLDEWRASIERPSIGADQFDAAAMASFQTWLCAVIGEDETEPRYNRTSVKKIVAFLCRTLAWAAREKRYGVTWDQYHECKSVPAPKPTRVREAQVVLPCPESDWQAACDTAHPQLAVILKVLWWTGARPNELLSVRMGPPPTKRTAEQKKHVYLQQSGLLSIPKVAALPLGVPTAVPLWAAHVRSKMRRKGHVRCLVFGPRSQAALLPLLEGLQPGEFLFSPKRTMGDRAGNRTTRLLKDYYTPGALERATKQACRRAKVTPFAPYQIRHRTSERIQAEMGKDAERAYLGHGEGITTEYAGFNSTLAAKVARAMG